MSQTPGSSEMDLPADQMAAINHDGHLYTGYRMYVYEEEGEELYQEVNT